MSDVPDFNTWLRDRGHVTRTWVLARRTPKMVARYGEDCTFFSQQRYSQLEEEHRIEVRDAMLDRLWFNNGSIIGAREVLTYAFELGRTAR